MEHYVPLHQQLAGVVETICEGRDNSERMFGGASFQKWLQRMKIPLRRCNGHFFASDLHKFAEQYGDVIGWNESNRAYSLTHGVRGIEWSNYRHPLREHVYDATCDTAEMLLSSKKDYSAVSGTATINMSFPSLFSFVRIRISNYVANI
ncbi:MAG: hypothetical protein ACXV5B_08570 [Halobacteriota archaeon]